MTPIVEKLKKLIAHEQSARVIGNTAEAESFATKIQEMLVRHKLSMSEVECAAEDQTNPIGTAVSPTKKTRVASWAGVLAWGIAQSFYCDHLVRDGHGRRKTEIAFIGRESDREAAAALFNYLYALGIEMAVAKICDLKSDVGVRSAVGKMRSEGFSDATKALNQIARNYKADFLTGYTSALYRRLVANKRHLEESAAPSAKGLILRDEHAIEEYIESRFEVTDHRIRAPKVHYSGALQAGYQAGENVSIAAKAAVDDGE